MTAGDGISDCDDYSCGGGGGDCMVALLVMVILT